MTKRTVKKEHSPAITIMGTEDTRKGFNPTLSSFYLFSLTGAQDVDPFKALSRTKVEHHVTYLSSSGLRPRRSTEESR